MMNRKQFLIQRNQFTDLLILVPRCRHQTVKCHRWILSLISPTLRHYFNNLQVEEEEDVIILDAPGLDIRDVEHFLDQVYSSLADQRDLDCQVPRPLLEVMGLSQPQSDLSDGDLFNDDELDLISETAEDLNNDSQDSKADLILPISKSKNKEEETKTKAKKRKITEKSDLSSLAKRRKSDPKPTSISVTPKDDLYESEDSDIDDPLFIPPKDNQDDVTKQPDGLTPDGQQPAADGMKCDLCGKLMPGGKASLAKHMRDLHGEKKHPCPKCDSSFVTPYKLRCHLDSKHSLNSQIQANITYEDMFRLARKSTKNQQDLSKIRPMILSLIHI